MAARAGSRKTPASPGRNSARYSRRKVVSRVLAAHLVQLGAGDARVVVTGEMEAAPFALRRVLSARVAFVEPVQAVGSGEQEGAAAAVDEHGAEDVFPERLRHVSGFVYNEEIQAGAAQGIVAAGAADEDGAATGEIQPAFGLGGWPRRWWPLPRRGRARPVMRCRRWAPPTSTPFFAAPGRISLAGRRSSCRSAARRRRRGSARPRWRFVSARGAG